jgi:hypothetical protein
MSEIRNENSRELTGITEPAQNNTEIKRTSRRGFAAMDPERQRRIASEGGRAAHMQGVAHQWTTEEARAAGRKGGQNSRSGARNRHELQG